MFPLQGIGRRRLCRRRLLALFQGLRQCPLKLLKCSARQQIGRVMHRYIVHPESLGVGELRLKSTKRPAEHRISNMRHRTSPLRLIPPRRKIVVLQHAMIAFVKKWSGANIRQVFPNLITRLPGHAW